MLEMWKAEAGKPKWAQAFLVSSFSLHASAFPHHALARWRGNDRIPHSLFARPLGGIGRRSGFKIHRPQGHIGSTPIEAIGTVVSDLWSMASECSRSWARFL